MKNLLLVLQILNDPIVKEFLNEILDFIKSIGNNDDDDKEED